MQGWVNASLKSAAPQTVHGRFRVLRTMMRDAVAQLLLGHDPTLRISFPDLLPKHEGDNALTPEALGAFLDALRIEAPQHHALVCTLAFTGLRFCHASALRWEDVDENAGVISVTRKNVTGVIGPISRKKRAPKVVPLDQDLVVVLRWHRLRLMRIANGEKRVGAWARRGLAEGWIFPSRSAKGTGPVYGTASLRKAWEKALAASKLDEDRFTVHGLRRTFNDLLRLAEVDETTKGALTAQTQRMREHYSTVAVEEFRAALRKAVGKVKTEVRSEGVSGLVSGPTKKTEEG